MVPTKTPSTKRAHRKTTTIQDTGEYALDGAQQAAAPQSSLENIADAVQFGRLLNRSLFFSRQYLITADPRAACRAEEEWAAAQGQIRRLAENTTLVEELTAAVGICRQRAQGAFESLSAAERREGLAEDLYRLSVQGQEAWEADLVYEQYLLLFYELRRHVFVAVGILPERLQLAIYLGEELDARCRPRAVWRVLELLQQMEFAAQRHTAKDGTKVRLGELLLQGESDRRRMPLTEIELPNGFVESFPVPVLPTEEVLLQTRLQELDIAWETFMAALGKADASYSEATHDSCLDIFIDRLRQNSAELVRQHADQMYLGLRLVEYDLYDACGDHVEIRGRQRIKLLRALLSAGSQGITRRKAYELLAGSRDLTDNTVDQTKAALNDDLAGLRLVVDFEKGVLFLRRLSPRESSTRLN